MRTQWVECKVVIFAVFVKTAPFRLATKTRPYRQYGWDFPEEIPEKSGKTPETLPERFLEFPSRVRLGSPKLYNSRHLKLPEHFQNGWGRLFFQKWFRRGPLRVCHGIPSSTEAISEKHTVYQKHGLCHPDWACTTSALQALRWGYR